MGAETFLTASGRQNIEAFPNNFSGI
jgi:hypothetical protein